jgi:hypothetical protein
MKYVFSVQSATEATIGYLEIAIIVKKEEIVTGDQKARLNCFSTHMELFMWNSCLKE